MNADVVVDGIVYRIQHTGGVSRTYSEILPRMCRLDPSLRISLLLEADLQQSAPTHPQIFHCAIPPLERYFRPGRLWKKITPQLKNMVRRRRIGDGRGKIWHSTLFSLPGRWNGSQVVMVYDLIHELFPDVFPGPQNDAFRAQKRHAVKTADAVLCISQTTSDDLQRLYGISDDRIRIIPLACSDIFRLETPPRAFGAGEPFLLYVGGRAGYKNFERLLDAYKRWPARREVKLAVVTYSWRPQELERLEASGLSSHVIMMSHVSDRELSALYRGAVALVHTSLYEGFGLPLLEAMASGCPIVASRIPTTVEIAGDCPIYFDPADSESLINALDIALAEQHHSKRRLQGMASADRYSWDDTATRILEVYYELWGRPVKVVSENRVPSLSHLPQGEGREQ